MPSAPTSPPPAPPVAPASARRRGWLVALVVLVVAAAGTLTAAVVVATRADATVPVTGAQVPVVAAPTEQPGWVVLVADPGGTGVTLRATPAVDADRLRTVRDGERLTARCAESGREVGDGAGDGDGTAEHVSTTWLRLADDAYLPAVFATVPGRETLPNCVAGGPELALAPRTVDVSDSTTEADASPEATTRSPRAKKPTVVPKARRPVPEVVVPVVPPPVVVKKQNPVEPDPVEPDPGGEQGEDFPEGVFGG